MAQRGRPRRNGVQHEQMRVVEAVTATLVRDSSLLRCPRLGCGAVRFHKTDSVEVFSNGTESIIETIYRCIECNSTYHLDQLEPSGR